MLRVGSWGVGDDVREGFGDRVWGGVEFGAVRVDSEDGGGDGVRVESGEGVVNDVVGSVEAVV